MATLVATAYNSRQSIFSGGPSLGVVCTIPSSSLTVGHRYLFLANTSVASTTAGANTINVQLRRAGIGAYGESTYVTENAYRYWRWFFPIVFTLNNSDDVQLTITGTSTCYAVGSCLIAIDLDSSADFPEGPFGWQHVTSAGLVTPSSVWAALSSLTFTPDGSSTYLVLGSAWFRQLTYPVYPSPYFAADMKIDSTVGGTIIQETQSSGINVPDYEFHVGGFGFLEAPPAAPLTLTNYIRETPRFVPGQGYNAVTDGTIVVIRLSTFQNFVYGTASSVGPFGTSGDQDVITRNLQGDFSNVILMGQVSATHTNVQNDSFNSKVTRYGSDILAGGSVPLANNDVNVPTVVTVASPHSNSIPYGYRIGCNVAPNQPAFFDAKLVAFTTRAQAPVIEVSAAGDLSVSGTAAPSILFQVSASASVYIDGSASPHKITLVDLNSDLTFNAFAYPQAVLPVSASSSFTISGISRPYLVLSTPLPSITRTFFNRAEDLRPQELAGATFEGDDTSPTFNRLVVVAPGQLQIDPLYSGPSYSFGSPPSLSPLKYGFKRGDKIKLFQADGESSGPNEGLEVTILDADNLSIFETLTHPDSTPYRFQVTRRGV